MECTTAVVALNVIRTKVVVIYIELLPDGTDATTDKWLKGGGSRPTEDAIQLNRDLNEFTITRIVVRASINKCVVVLVNCIVDDAGLEADTEPVVNVVAEFCVESETWLEGEIFCCFSFIRIGLHIGSVVDAASGQLPLDRTTDGGVHEEIVVGAKVDAVCNGGNWGGAP